MALLVPSYSARTSSRSTLRQKERYHLIGVEFNRLRAERQTNGKKKDRVYVCMQNNAWSISLNVQQASKQAKQQGTLKQQQHRRPLRTRDSTTPRG